MLTGKKILIGITGAIAAYKACELIRLFKKNGAMVRVIVTKSALNFVTKTTLESLSQNELNADLFDTEREYRPEHIALSDWADIFVIVPITANTIAKIANGICDNLLTTTYCAYKGQVIIAPCMNTKMWENRITQENLNKLKQIGIRVIEPDVGFLACGSEGKGRLADINTIFETVKNCFDTKNLLSGQKVVITSGGTKEDIDTVRYIGNYSSGKMGLALADSVFEYGGNPVLITTVNVQRDYKVINVKTAQQMYEATDNEFKEADILIMAAAVSDYRVKNKYNGKIKKNGSPLTLELVENPDILMEMSKKKRDGQIVIGFCAESDNLIENAKQKILKKGCDYICANDISRTDTGFASDYNEVYIIDKNFKVQKMEKTTKTIIAKQILELINGKSK